MKQLFIFLEKNLEIPTLLIPEVSNYFNEEVFSKGDYLVKQNYYCQKLSVVYSGYFRVHSEPGEKKITHWIYGPNQFVTDISSFFQNNPAKWNIEAISKVKAYTLNLENYKKLKSTIANWYKYENKMLLKMMSGLENRVHSFLAMTTQQRYDYLFKTYPNIFNEIPLHYIASMLGMRAETLSRIRNSSKS